MSVFVDDEFREVRGTLMCRMFANTRQELRAMALALGINLKWIQRSKTRWEHFDVCKTKRAKAIQMGAKQLTAREVLQRKGEIS